MEQVVPNDQQIVEEYFDLATHPKTAKISWLYGMVATYGLKPNELEDFSWNTNNSINIKSKKRSIKPLHPQWTILFNLKKKQPYIKEDCFRSTFFEVEDLLKAYKNRKKFYRNFRQQRSNLSLVSAA